MTNKKFYRKCFQVEVLSEEPFDEYLTLEDLHEMISTGPCSGKVSVVEQEEVDGLTMARLLLAQGSDPSFFRLDDEGNSEDDE